MIEILATALTRGTVNKSDHAFGTGLIVDGGQKQADLEWEFFSRKEGNYVLYAYFASSDSRPVKLSLNNIMIDDKALHQRTGGFYLDQVKKNPVGAVHVKKGLNVLSLVCDNFIPHIAKFTLESKTGVLPRMKDALEHYFLINPYKRERPSLMRKFMHHGLLFGFTQALKKTALYLNPKHVFLREWADCLGVFSREHAYIGPKMVQIDITNNCNNDCVGCWCHSTFLEEKQMTPSQKKKYIPYPKMVEILDELKETGCREIYFAGGGDPSTHPQFMDILEKTKANGFVAYVNTNFTLFTKDMIRRCVEIGLDHFTLSVWAGSENAYMATHPNKKEGEFLKLKEKITFLNSIKNGPPYTKVYNVISSRNYFDLKNMISFAIDTHSDSVEFTMADIVGGKTEFLLLSDTELKALRQDAHAIWKSYEAGELGDKIELFRYHEFLRRIQSDADTLSGEYDKNIISKLPCTIGWTFSRINADGTVNGCLKSHRIPVGNIHDNQFSEIWNGEKQKWFRRHSLAMKQDDPFFRMIGNDSGCAMGCVKSCDDIGRNQSMQEKLKELSFPVKLGLQVLSLKNEWNRSFKSQKRKLSSLDPKLQGYIDGTKTFTGPRLAVIDLTNFCASQCVTCFTKSPLLGENKPNEDWFKHKIDTEKLKDLLKQLQESGCEKVRFTGGGDPMFYKGIESVVELCKQYKFQVNMTSNLYGVNEQTFVRCLAAGLDELTVSLMSAKSATYEQTHPGSKKGGFETILSMIEKARGFSSLKICIAHVIHKYNYRELMDMFDLGLQLNVDAIYFAVMDTVNGALDTVALSESEIHDVLDQCAKIETMARKQNRMQIDGFSSFKYKLKQQLGGGTEAPSDMPQCSVGWHFTRVTAEGNVLPCCRGAHKPMGNIADADFSSVWNNSLYAEFRQKTRAMSENEEYFKPFKCHTHCDNMDHNQQFYDEFLT